MSTSQALVHWCGYFGHLMKAADPINRGPLPPTLLPVPAVAADCEVPVPRGGERERGRSPLPCRLVPCGFSPPFPASACASDLAGKSPFFHSVGVLLPENSILGFRGKKRVRLNFGLAVVYSVPVALHVDCGARRCHMRIYCG